MDRKLSLWLATLGLCSLAHGQFVYPRPEYHEHEEGLYKEDPFITHYRKEFFSVFAGDFPRFEKAYAEIKTMSAKNQRDARAMIWLGNGETVEAGLQKAKGHDAEARKLLQKSRETLDRAVALRPEDPNVYMMRAATLYIQGQFWPSSQMPLRAWEELRDDCLRFIAFLGPKMARVSIHVRGETYGELGIAYEKLGDKAKAKAAFRKIIALDPGTDYETRAQKELERLG